MRKGLVSVIIPAYNCEKTIERAIESILKQTYQELEIIVVDDMSTDDTARIAEKVALREPRVQLFRVTKDDPYRFDAKLSRNINAGYSARNEGFKHVHGEFVTFQDADDESFLNRIETQLVLLKENDADHVTTDWMRYDDQYHHRKFDFKKYKDDGKLIVTGPKELYDLSQKTKGLLPRVLGTLHRLIPFHLKRARIVNRLFFGAITNYPGVTGIPLFKSSVLTRVQFRALPDRVWPSFMGRGADRDFSFHVAEQFKNSYVFFIPLYLWRVKNENARYDASIARYITPKTDTA